MVLVAALTNGSATMSKYYRLKEFLSDRNQDYVPMTFAEIEKVLEFALPASKQYPAWWSNNPSNNPMTREWLDAGFVTEAVNIASERLVFRRVNGPAVKRASPAGNGGGQPGERRPLHPGIGFMKGLIKVAPGFDVSGPFSDEDWEGGYLGEDRLGSGKVGLAQK
jgi:hypothetical protein